MKKALLIIVCLCGIAPMLYAQKKPAVVINSKVDSSKLLKKYPTDAIKINAGIIVAPGIVVYEHDNFRGRNAPFVKNADGTFSFPFSLEQVSFRVPAGKIVYIKYCLEFPTEAAYASDQRSVNLKDVCGIRTDEQVKIEVAVGGISTEVHNRDCKRVSGSVEALVTENSLPGENISDIIMPKGGASSYAARRLSNPSALMLYYPLAYPTSDRTYDVNDYYAGAVFNNNPLMIILRKAPAVKPEYDLKGYFIVGKNALRDGRVSILLRTNLVSQHKSCDLCTDYHSDVRMEAPVTEIFPINKTYGDGKKISAAKPFFIAGPYNAYPYKRENDPGHPGAAPVRERDNALVKHLRVHVVVNGL
jgi:hypothetical protein